MNTTQTTEGDMMTTTKKTQRTWLNVQGEEWTYHADSRPTGHRITALRWLEDNPNTGHKAGDLVLRDITGDFWKRPESAVTHDETVIPNGTDEDADRYAGERLA